jgi:hypothetical protein
MVQNLHLKVKAANQESIQLLQHGRSITNNAVFFN